MYGIFAYIYPLNYPNVALVLQIPCEKVFRYPKTTPKPLAEGSSEHKGRYIPHTLSVFPWIVGLSFREMQHVMASSRPVAFFDFEAMERAKPRYAALFAEEGDAMKDAKCKEEALALLWRLFLGEFYMGHCESNFLFEDLNKVTSVRILFFF